MKKTELPKTIRIIGKEYKITYTKHYLKYKEGRESRLALAIHYGNEGRIKAKVDKLCKDEVMNSLLHESFHGISHRLRLGLKENQVDKLSIGVQALLKDNPKIYELLK